MKRPIMLLLTAVFLATFILSSCSTGQQKVTDATTVPATADEVSAEDAAVIEAFYANFTKLTEIPRPSHHEEKISRFLYDWAVEKGYSAVQDENLNVMFDVPATSGKEALPLVALQVHMDMVAVGADGVDFDPLTDPIKPIRDDKSGTVTADGTSLGADDGAGIGMIMTLLEGDAEHGPLRIIITTNEEDGLTGTFNMDPEWVSTPKYLINVDAEDSTAMTVSTASADIVSGSKEVETNEPRGNLALTVSISGLKGGHSGVEIDKGRCNATVARTMFLTELNEQNFAFDIASLEGGSAPNAIPDKASCVIVIEKGSKEIVTSAAQSYLKKLQADYKGIENSIEFAVADTAMPSSVISAQDADDAVYLITNIIDGVYTMSPDKEDLVESSSNLGTFSLSDKGSAFITCVRSSVGEKRTKILDEQLSLARTCGYTVKTEKTADPWPYNPDNQLMELAAKVYKEQNGTDYAIIAVHAGLECGSYAVYNPELMMICIGPDLKDVHTPKETLTLGSVPKIYKLLKGILLSIE